MRTFPQISFENTSNGRKRYNHITHALRDSSFVVGLEIDHRYIIGLVPQKFIGHHTSPLYYYPDGFEERGITKKPTQLVVANKSLIVITDDPASFLADQRHFGLGIARFADILIRLLQYESLTGEKDHEIREMYPQGITTIADLVD